MQIHNKSSQYLRTSHPEEFATDRLEIRESESVLHWVKNQEISNVPADSGSNKGIMERATVTPQCSV